MGGGGVKHRNAAKRINEHRITARKVDETPSSSHTLRFEITATPQIEILFTASKKKTSTPQHSKSPCPPPWDTSTAWFPFYIAFRVLSLVEHM